MLASLHGFLNNLSGSRLLVGVFFLALPNLGDVFATFSSIPWIIASCIASGSVRNGMVQYKLYNLPLHYYCIMASSFDGLFWNRKDMVCC